MMSGDISLAGIDKEESLELLIRLCETYGLTCTRAACPGEGGYYYLKDGKRTKMSEEEMREAVFGAIKPPNSTT